MYELFEVMCWLVFVTELVFQNMTLEFVMIEVKSMEMRRRSLLVKMLERKCWDKMVNDLSVEEALQKQTDPVSVVGS